MIIWIVIGCLAAALLAALGTAVYRTLKMPKK